MTSRKFFQRLTSLKKQGTTDESLHSSWENILLQIALPIILILAFTSMTKLSSAIRDYELKKAELNALMQEYRTKREKIEAFLNNVRNTSLKEQIQKRTDTVIALQKQKVIKALGEIRYDEKIASGIYMPTTDIRSGMTAQWRSEAYLHIFPADSVSIIGGMIQDKGWKPRFNSIYAISKDSSQRAMLELARYRKVISRSGLSDPHMSSAETLLSVMKQKPDRLEQSADALSDSGLIQPDNRIFAWKAIQNFSGEIERDAVTLQKNILNRIFDYYIMNPDDLDRLDKDGTMTAELKRLTSGFSAVDSKLKRAQRNRILSMIENIFHNYLDKSGYHFLDRTWDYYESS